MHMAVVTARTDAPAFRSRMCGACSQNRIASRLQCFFRVIELVRFYQNIIRAVSTHDKDADFFCCQDGRNLGEDADQRKIERAFDSKGSPSVISGYDIAWHILCQTDKRVFFICFPNETERGIQIYL